MIKSFANFVYIVGNLVRPISRKIKHRVGLYFLHIPFVSFCQIKMQIFVCIYKIDPRRKKIYMQDLPPCFYCSIQIQFFFHFQKLQQQESTKLGEKKVRILQNHLVKCESFTFCKPYLTPIQLKYKTPRILRTFSNLCFASTISKTAFNGTLLFQAFFQTEIQIGMNQENHMSKISIQVQCRSKVHFSLFKQIRLQSLDKSTSNKNSTLSSNNFDYFSLLSFA